MWRFVEKQYSYVSWMKSEEDVENGLALLSESQTKASQNGHWIETLRAKNQRKDQVELGGESGKVRGSKVEHGRKRRVWPVIRKDGKDV